jgi:cation:H+ antiporter
VLVNLLLLAVGLAGLTLAADRFVLGAAQVAARLQVSTVVTGALIIGFGTSAPELVVSTLATLTEGAEGTALAVGNIVGSNIANLTLVLAVPVLVFGRIVLEEGVKRQAALSAGGVTVFFLIVWLADPSAWWGLLLLVLTGVALRLVLWLGDRFGGVPPPDTSEGAAPWFWSVIGLVGTVGSAWLVVWSATRIAEDLEWTGGFVGFALVALGTSLPELVTVLAAARRNESGLIVGNLLGSNLFNSLLVGAAVFLANGSRTLDEEAGVGLWVVAVLVAVSWLVISFMRSGGQISRGESGILLSCYVTVLVLMAATGATA